MYDLIKGEIDLDARAAGTIAAAMRELARADGSHPMEEALIDAFEADLPPGGRVMDLSTVQEPGAREALLKSLILLAWADGSVSEPERAVIQRYASELGTSTEELGRIYTSVAASLLHHFSGVHLFRQQVLDIGRQLGLDEQTIEQALKSD